MALGDFTKEEIERCEDALARIFHEMSPAKRNRDDWKIVAELLKAAKPYAATQKEHDYAKAQQQAALDPLQLVAKVLDVVARGPELQTALDEAEARLDTLFGWKAP
jgi:hypothetical protein